VTQKRSRNALLSVALAAFALVPAAFGHVSVSPGLLEAGRATTLRIELPELRPGDPPTTLAVSAPGLETLASSNAGRVGEESRWRVRVTVDAEPGPLVLDLTARYADGRSVVVRQTVTVLPAKSDSASSWPVAAAAVVVAVLAVLAVLALVRRSQAPARPREG
jgi:hypothetical protein